MLQKHDSLCVAKEYGTFPLSRVVQWSRRRSGCCCKYMCARGNCQHFCTDARESIRQVRVNSLVRIANRPMMSGKSTSWQNATLPTLQEAHCNFVRPHRNKFVLAPHFTPLDSVNPRRHVHRTERASNVNSHSCDCFPGFQETERRCVEILDHCGRGGFIGNQKLAANETPADWRSCTLPGLRRPFRDYGGSWSFRTCGGLPRGIAVLGDRRPFSTNFGTMVVPLVAKDTQLPWPEAAFP